MTEPATSAVVAALRDRGFAVRFVGGCVRDALLGRPIGDIDIATDATPDEVTRCLQEAGVRVVPTGVAHGTVTAVVAGTAIEITTLRRDVETDGRRAKVRFTDDWDADAARRDLTINAISLEPDGVLHDPFGGREDLLAGRIRFVGDAHARIVEDVLRLLRYFRFYAHYGRSPPDPPALAACRALAPRLASLSAERVRAELLKLLAAPDPVPALRLMRDATALQRVLPEATGLPRLARLVAIEAETGAGADSLRRLAALLDANAAAVEPVAARLRLSNAEREYLALTANESVSPALDEAARRRVIHRLGPAAFRECALLGWAADGDDAAWRDLLDQAGAWKPKVFPVTGQDVLDRGVSPGPAVGDLLGAVEAWWVDGGFVAGREACLARLDREIDRRKERLDR